MILAVDTSTRLISIALHSGTRLLAEHSWHSSNQHSVELSPAIETMLDKAGISSAELTALAVAQGPGSFTGLRIGISVAKAMAMALQLPLVAVPTFDIVAYATPYFKGSLYVAVQAGRGRIHMLRYRWQKGGWMPTDEVENTDWESFLQSLDKTVLISGDIDERGYGLLEETDKPVEIASGTQRLRRAGHLAQIALEQLSNADLPEPSYVKPIYLNTL
jgi:tRNA threonylcarbamoyladenosine biosynthesis protein TsaB